MRRYGDPRLSAYSLLFCAVAFLAFRPMISLSADETSPSQPESSLADELPRIPPTPPEKALETFHVQRGFSLELVAAEPDVSDPVDACFDADGRMYVAEMHGYPFSQEPTRLNPQGGGKPDAGIIRRLEDTDGDGRMDRSTRFADGISWPTSVCCYRGGVLVLAPPALYYFRDDDGDGRADTRETVFTGFGRDNVQSVANNMKWTLDQKVALAAGRNPGTLQRDGEELLTLGNQDFCFDPATNAVEPLTGGVQFGHSFDDWGHRFVCSNSNHIQQVTMEVRYLNRNPYFQAPNTIPSIAREGAAAPVFRRSPPEPWRVVRTRRRVADPAFRKRASNSEQHAVGFFTSATGVTIYRGDAYPEEFQGNAFIGDVGGNLVHRKHIQGDGPVLTAIRADENAEFVASTDNWFRPVNFVNAPDGTLYILDMYRETIEHPYSIPEDIKAHLHLESGDDRGRIYRLRPPGWQPPRPRKLSGASSQELVQELASANAWNRETAQRLLWERQDKSVVGELRDLAKNSEASLGRLHALWTLRGLDSLDDDTLQVALADAHPGVRTQAVRLAEGSRTEGVLERLAALTGDDSEAVRYQLAQSLGDFDDERAIAALGMMIRDSRNTGNIRAALMTSVNGRADRLASTLLEDREFAQSRSARDWLTTLTRTVGASPDSAAARRLLKSIATMPAELAPLQWSLITALQEGLERRGTKLSEIVTSKDAADGLQAQMQAVFQTAAASAKNGSLPETTRRSAIHSLSAADSETALAQLPEFLTPQAAQPLQQAAIQALSAHRDPRVPELLLEGWKNYSPNIRRDVLDVLTSDNVRALALLDAVKQGTVMSGEIPSDRRQLLANHPSQKVRELAATALDAAANPDRQKVVEEYQRALAAGGDAARGRMIFEKKCATCHKVGDIGHQVGPEFTSVQNKSPEDLLIAILDPSRELQPNFTSYTVVTLQGTILTGLIAAESSASLTLRRAEGKEDVVLRDNIETIVSSGKSLMPDGMEKEITPTDAVDVIAFIKELGQAN